MRTSVLQKAVKKNEKTSTEWMRTYMKSIINKCLLARVYAKLLQVIKKMEKTDNPAPKPTKTLSGYFIKEEIQMASSCAGNTD